MHNLAEFDPKPRQCIWFCSDLQASLWHQMTYDLAHQNGKLLEEDGKSRIYNYLWHVKAVLLDYLSPMVLGASRLACSMICISWRFNSLGFLEVHYSQKQKWAEVDLFFKYTLNLKKNPSHIWCFKTVALFFPICPYTIYFELLQHHWHHCQNIIFSSSVQLLSWQISKLTGLGIYCKTHQVHFR